MNEEEMRYRVTAVVSTTMQIVVQARSEEEAEAFSDAIDFEKWQVISSGRLVKTLPLDFLH